uniref:Uncharacterized protein n=1 Tax=Triticum urartu TaxID=4572 RepID=A0A8R7THF4_TRIUA
MRRRLMSVGHPRHMRRRLTLLRHRSHHRTDECAGSTSHPLLSSSLSLPSGRLGRADVSSFTNIDDELR